MRRPSSPDGKAPGSPKRGSIDPKFAWHRRASLPLPTEEEQAALVEALRESAAKAHLVMSEEEEERRLEAALNGPRRMTTLSSKYHTDGTVKEPHQSETESRLWKIIAATNARVRPRLHVVAAAGGDGRAPRREMGRQRWGRQRSASRARVRVARAIATRDCSSDCHA